MNIINSRTYRPAPIKGGYTDRILKIDLTSATISIETIDQGFREKFIGGRGYALKLIWDGTSAETQFDSPENILVFSGGPLCSEPRFPGTGKFIVGTISPLTETFIDSNVGGHFAPLMKLCGFDAIAITGLSHKDVVVVINGDQGSIDIMEAPQIDQDTELGALSYGESILRILTNDQINEDIAAVTAGIGAVNTRFGIINSLYYDPRRKRLRAKQAGRGGTGTVMRHKGLRAVVVNSSLPRIGANNPVDPMGVKEAGGKLKRVISQMDPKQLRLSLWGTPVLVEYMDRYHLLPVQNYQYGQHPDSSKVFADVFLERYFEKRMPDGCYLGCNLACAKGAEKVRLSRGPMAGKDVGIDGPEYENIAAVTGMGIFDPQFVMEYNWYCDNYGLDTISMGVTASFLMECYQRGFLTEREVGYPLQWGDGDTAFRLLHETALGKGFGRVCGQGVKRAKEWVAKQCSIRIAKPIETVMAELNKFAMEVKGLEFSMYIPKESLAQQGGYGFSLKGPQHDEAWLIFIDQIHNELPTFEMKAEALKWFPLVRTWFNAVGLCKLPWIDVRHPEAASTKEPSKNHPSLSYFVEYLNATTGSKKAVEDILEDSERLYMLQKLINLRQGRGTREHDQVPARAMGPAFPNEYQAREEYYDQWLRKELNHRELPSSLEQRQRLLMELRQKAYSKLCDVVYEEKGFSAQGIPFPEVVERLGLLDQQAAQLLQAHGMAYRKRALSN